MMDNQIIKRPICMKCKKNPAVGGFMTMWVCGDCMIKLTELYKKKQNKWIQEVDLDEGEDDSVLP